ncbi:(Fe-S)-binding protein [Candidatus Formimonas warabiya]|uniref:4Fe-4S ferredoxin-type domain-containing protein n=1 Tax=Formimonas warabiya TaxID=1761012 RepID=A0A3G1KYN8_FORW1|nr:(Fe-S)-binding protein [Candidatus Formimonas warabiya]ATW27520.1 hypothetical protein DCMF_24665 [Candidatus Formimonas warabiya]
MAVIQAKNLDPEFKYQIADVLAGLGQKSDFSHCLACGMCTAGCSYSDVHQDMDPRKFLRKIILGLKEEVVHDPFIWKCTMCGRCTMFCPMKVDLAGVVRTVRGHFGLKAPGHIQEVADIHMATGNQQALSAEDYLDTLNWLEEELQEEVQDAHAKIPLDKKGADILYVINSREAKFYPQDIQNVAKIFYAAKADWTMSSEGWDATNMGLFSGRDEDARKIVGMIDQAMKRLRCKTLVVTECGHALRSQSWGGKAWFQRSYPVKSIVEIILGYLKEGRIKVASGLFPEKFTYHDPCNFGRKEGLLKEPREVLQYLGIDLVEMYPNREYNLCCGGGGGANSMGTEMGLRAIRMEKGRLKAEQIKKTAAAKIIVPCHNCFDQLTDIGKYFKLGTKVVHISTLVAKSLILDDKLEGGKSL